MSSASIATKMSSPLALMATSVTLGTHTRTALLVLLLSYAPLPLTLVDPALCGCVHDSYLANGIIYTAGGLLVSGNLLVCVLCLVGFGISWGKRIAAEEAMLQKHVAGYKSYMKDTRYRLVPGVW